MSLFKINALLICLFLSSCSSFLKIETDKTVDSFYIANRLEAQYPQLEDKIHLHDRYYHLVDKKQIKAMSDKSWRPWVNEKGDCDDQVNRALLYIREKYYISSLASSPPAIGQLTGHLRGGEDGHAVLWGLTENGLFLYDLTSQKFIGLDEINAWRAF